MSKAEQAVLVRDVTKTFKLPHEQHNGIKQLAINMLNGKRGYEKQTVLKDISFDIKRGEFFGIVGRNGSGKSTLLKLLASIYAPDKGLVQINGSLTPFIELGVGFNPELTGRENVYMNGALLGFDRRQMDKMYDEIVEFAELDKFMDQKLKNYSSGMQVRLAFSIAIRAQSDILLIDEVLAVGDAAFQQKCYDYFDELKRQKRTIILVSHDMGAVKQFCDRAILVSKGKIIAEGRPGVIADEYEKLNYADAAIVESQAHHDIELTAFDTKGRQKNNFKYGDEIILKASWPETYTVGHLGFLIYKNEELVFATNSFNEKNFDGGALKIKARLGNGRYRLKVGLFKTDRHDLIGIYGEKAINIYGQPTNGDHNEEWEGLVYLDNEWEG